MSEYLLVIDDDAMFLALMINRLGTAGYKVTTAMDGLHAVIQARAVKPRLVISDIEMPIWGTGVEVYRKLRETTELKEVPVIFLTGMDAEKARGLVPHDPQVRLLAKPVDWTMLEQAIDELLGEDRELKE